MDVKFDIKLTDGQKKAYELIHNDDIQYLVCRFSRQSGKSVFAEIMLIEYLFKPNTFNVYVSPTFNLGRKVFKEISNLLAPTKIIKKANGSTLTIETIYNSTLQFLSVDAYTSIRGLTVSGILVMDETAYYPDILPNGENIWWNVLLPLTKARNPKVLVISTPNGKHGLFWEMHLKAVNGEKGYAEISRTIYDDELISNEKIEELKKGYPPLAWQQEFECKFLDNAITVFPGFEKCFNIDEYTDDRCWIGIDPSTVGDDNTILTIVNTKNEVKQVKIDGELDVKYRKMADIINKHKPIATYIESNSIGEVMANEIKKNLNRKGNFYTFNTSNQTKKDYISIIAVEIANENIHFERNNTLLYSEMGTYTYKLTKTGNITYAAKDGLHDDTISSLGLALQCKNDFKYTGNKNNVFMPNMARIIR